MIAIFFIPVNKNRFAKTTVNINITSDNLNDINAITIHIGNTSVGNTVFIENKQKTLFKFDFELNNKEFTKYIDSVVVNVIITMNSNDNRNIFKYGIFVCNVTLLIFALYIAVKYSLVITP